MKRRTGRDADIAALANRLGFTNLRPGQEEAAAAVVAGRDTLAVMPTGSGKSAIYQLAAAAGAGPVLVISPLIALQADQVSALESMDLGEASEINSTMSAGRRRETLEQLAAGKLQFSFVAPEQLANEETLEAARQGGVGLLVVDEAHCVSSWGHDFRPDYLHIGEKAELLGRPVILALTATAAPPVREEISQRLGMVDPLIVVRGFDRPNIHLAVSTHHDADEKFASFLEETANRRGPGIVYVATRRETEEIAAALAEAGLRADAYHGGMAASRRSEVQDSFMSDDLDVVVATTAFGMGIDKPNVRYVVHYEVSDSVDSYYQELGRAGRDGEPAEAVLYYRPEDLGLRRFFAGGADVDHDVLAAVAEQLADEAGPITAAQLAEGAGLVERETEAALRRLVETGWAQISPDPDNGADRFESLPSEQIAEEAADEAALAQENHRQLQKSRVEMMRLYAEGRSCRRQFILSYFGEPFEPPCGNCDACERGPVDTTTENGEWWPNRCVMHAEWGSGTVLRVEEGERIVVLFDTVGYKTLSASLVAQSGVLTPVPD